MNEIKLLDKNTIDQIAAGEVVDRPASIIKELVENSIDAGANSISVEIRGGGIELIRVTDNGSGIPADQIRLAFLRHSTSKISTAQELSFIHTLGFRGEALSSIAAVSKTEICTKTKDSLTGIIYKINGGEEESFQEAGLPDGTTMIVRDLFYNTPARRKFLKSSQTESGYVMDIMQRIALSRPDIAFKFTMNGAVRISTPGNGSLNDVIYSIFGRDITANLLSLDQQNDIVQINGFIGKPEIARGNRNFEFFFINGRFIKDKILQKALEESYIGYQMKGTFPFAILNIQMEPELVDVNVHPAKREVRFFDNERIFDSVYDILRNRIVGRESIPVVPFGKEEKTPDIKKPENTYVPEPFETISPLREQQVYGNTETAAMPVQENIPKPFQDKIPWSDRNPADIPVSQPSQEEEAIPEDITYQQQELFQADFISEQARKKHRIIGEIFDTYWIVEYEDKLYIIDQHAAHEKVLYEKFMKAVKENTHYSQQILPSVIVTLSSKEEEALQKYLKKFEELGFEIEHFGGNEYAISAVPADLITVDHKILFMEMLEELSSSYTGKEAEVLTDRIATAACKAAVKGGSRLSFGEADALIGQLLTLENPYNCPHGRPTIITMSKYELEKKFKRIV